MAICSLRETMELSNNSPRKASTTIPPYPAMARPFVFVRRGPVANRSSLAEELGNRDDNELWILPLATPRTPQAFGSDRGMPTGLVLFNPSLLQMERISTFYAGLETATHYTHFLFQMEALNSW